MAGTEVSRDAVHRRVAAAAAADSGGLPADLLRDFLPLVERAAATGTPLRRRDLRTYQAVGDAAAGEGIALRALLDLYSSAAWRLWRHLPAVRAAVDDPAAVVAAGEVMLRAVDDVVAALTEGFQLARRNLVPLHGSARREFVDDLLIGGADVAGLLRRADGFGLDLSGPHAVAAIEADQPFTDAGPMAGTLERSLRGSKGDAHALVASKDGLLVAVFAAPGREAVAGAVSTLTRVLGDGSADRVHLQRDARVGNWQVGVSRPRPGVDGVVASFQEARDALRLAKQLGLTTPVVDARDLLVYAVLVRDRSAIDDLVEELLSPLLRARGGPEQLLETLQVYFDTGGNAALTGRRLHISVRAVTYRLARVEALSGRDPTSAGERFAWQSAVLGAKLLGWPRR